MPTNICLTSLAHINHITIYRRGRGHPPCRCCSLSAPRDNKTHFIFVYFPRLFFLSFFSFRNNFQNPTTPHILVCLWVLHKPTKYYILLSSEVSITLAWCIGFEYPSYISDLHVGTVQQSWHCYTASIKACAVVPTCLFSHTRCVLLGSLTNSFSTPADSVSKVLVQSNNVLGEWWQCQWWLWRGP